MFICGNKNSSSGRAFLFNWCCSFLISYCNFCCFELSLVGPILLFLSSPWTSLLRCSHTLIWNQMNALIIFAPQTNGLHCLVPAVDDCSFVDSYHLCSHLSLSFPRNILYHIILVCAKIASLRLVEDMIALVILPYLAILLLRYTNYWSMHLLSFSFSFLFVDS